MTTPDFSGPIRDWMPTVIYVGHRTSMPDVIMGRWPEEAVRVHGRTYKTWICETPKELRTVQKRLAEPCPITNGALDFRKGPDGALSGRAAGMMPRSEIVVALYQPPEDGWPWLILQSIPVDNPDIERMRYAWEGMSSEAAALAHLERLARMAAEHPGAAGIHILQPEVRQ